MISFPRLLFLLILTTALGDVVSAQEKLTPEQKVKLVAADKAAESFVERYRKTLDFGEVWREFKTSDARCAYRLTPMLETREKDFGRYLKTIGLDENLSEKLYIDFWSGSLISQAYFYSYAPSENGNEPNIEKITAPNGRKMRKVLSAFKSLSQGDSELKSRSDFIKVRNRLRNATNIFRRNMPPDLLATKNWESAKLWFNQVHGVGGQVTDRIRYIDRCPWTKGGPIYVSQVGFFVFDFVEEDGEMKLWTMSWIDD